MDTGKDYKEDRAYQRWKRLMQLGSRTGCHQRSDRSFYLHGYQLPVCARCTGVLIGYVVAIPIFFLTGLRLLLALTGCLIMFGDWLLQEREIKESNNGRRLFTGLLGGFGIMTLQLYLIKRFILYLIKNITHD